LSYVYLKVETAARHAASSGGVEMPMDTEPLVGAVYEDTEGRSFQVVGFDENEATVKLRYDDDNVEEIDLDAWYEMDLELISSPEDAEEEDEDLDDEVTSDEGIEEDEEEDDGDDDDYEE
jgi:hypothetical protein